MHPKRTTAIIASLCFVAALAANASAAPSVSFAPAGLTPLAAVKPAATQPAPKPPAAQTPRKVSVTAEQIRGVAGRNAQLNGGNFTIPKGSTGTITGVQCDGDSLYLQGPSGGTFSPASKAIGRSLPAGSYHFHPNLKPKQDRAGATITYSY